jgi:8-oxo-dGTP pyrophosphatase MutT (NUDIX family)
MPVGTGVIWQNLEKTGCWLSRRIGGIYHGWIQTPGGTVDGGETPRQAIGRETWEETGHRFPLADFVHLSVDVYNYPDGGTSYASYMFLLTSAEVPQNAEPGKHTGWTFHTWEEISRLSPVLPSILAVLRHKLHTAIQSCTHAK